ncbi:hypothetical protein ACFL5I_00525 [Planctomycetota bacterium]
MVQTLNFSLAGLIVGFRIKHKELESKISPDLMRLQSDRNPDIQIEVSYRARNKIPIEDIPGPYPHRLPFLWRPRKIQCYSLSSSRQTGRCYGVIKLDKSCKRGDFLIDRDCSFPKQRPPLDVPVLFVLLGQIFPGQIISLHATGGLDKTTGKGMLFAGLSGAGKTTMANLWEKEGARVLGEEQIIIRKIGRKLWGYPYPGINGQVTNSCPKITLDAIFLLRHAPRNILKGLVREEIIHRLFNLARFASTAYPPCPKDLLNSYSFIDDTIEAVPVYELGFVPNRKIIDFVRRQLTSIPKA